MAGCVCLHYGRGGLAVQGFLGAEQDRDAWDGTLLAAVGREAGAKG